MLKTGYRPAGSYLSSIELPGKSRVGGGAAPPYLLQPKVQKNIVFEKVDEPPEQIEGGNEMQRAWDQCFFFAIYMAFWGSKNSHLRKLMISRSL